MMKQSDHEIKETDIAIIGMSCRFPGADNPDIFWQNLCNGVESVSFFSEDELAPGDSILHGHANYVKAYGILSDIEQFDAKFFGCSPKEAKMMDPQQRLFLECAWEALEHAGYNSESYDGLIGVYAGAGLNSYLLHNLYPTSVTSSSLETMNDFQILMGHEKDFLSPRVSYKLNLRGPSVTIQTACSTGLVAVHLACQSLLSGECDVAMAGSVSIRVPQKRGYVYQEGMIFSPDGHCRAFDAQAQGTVFGNGAGVVVLKHLREAINDGDYIHAVIKGSAINNDGALKVGFYAPSVEGQASVISEALAVADVHPRTITYIETHGTGTILGDPIEIEALIQAFRSHTEENGFCAIGSVKTNVGHLAIAAGMVGLIKTILAIEHKQIPASLHFSEPNPHIDFANSPFYVNTRLSEWKIDGMYPRRAGVSSFGMGGTNAHVILEEAPSISSELRTDDNGQYLLALSAKTELALQELVQRYVDYLSNHPEISPEDLCFTANTGRRHFDHRVAIVASSVIQFRKRLKAFSEGAMQDIKKSVNQRKTSPPIISFLFTGQGSQYRDMGRQLYETQPVFRKTLEQCDEILRPYQKKPLLEVLYPPSNDQQSSNISQTAYTQTALFAIEYALNELWQSWDVKPDIVMGHSVGEYVAACVAGVFNLEEGLKLIAERGRLMQALPQNGKMVVVWADEEEVSRILQNYAGKISIAAINGPQNTVISGRCEAIQDVVTILRANNIRTKTLTVSHAFHSPLMQPMIADFEQTLGEVSFALPEIKLISNVTGKLATEEIATSKYWLRHILQPVRFAEGMEALYRHGVEVFLEIGPQPHLLGMAKQLKVLNSNHKILYLSSLHQTQNDWEQLLNNLGKLYVAGVPIDWSHFERNNSRHRLSLPTYPFQRERYWVEPPEEYSATTQSKKTQNRDIYSPHRQRASLIEQDLENWLYKVIWQPEKRNQDEMHIAKSRHWLIFADRKGIGTLIAEELVSRGYNCTQVFPSSTYQQIAIDHYQINPAHPEDFRRLIRETDVLQKRPRSVCGIIHLWSLDEQDEPSLTELRYSQTLGCGSVLHLVQALMQGGYTPPLWLVTQGAQPVEVPIFPFHVVQSPVWGLGKAINLEFPELHCVCVDLDPLEKETAVFGTTLFQEVFSPIQEEQVAYRQGQRYVARLQQFKIQEFERNEELIQTDGSYLITGGLGGIGLKVAQWLAEQGAKQLVLAGRSGASSQRAQKAIIQLEQKGVRILVVKADIAESEDAVELLKTCPSPLRGIIHAAGVLDDGVLQQQSLERFNQVMRPKVMGAWNLHLLTQNIPLDFFLLFSSAASLLGSRGQSSYVAANAFMDALAHYRRTLGLPALSVNWGAWAETGMTAELDQLHQHRLSTLGVQLITSQQGLRILEDLIQQDVTQVAVLPMNWEKWLLQFHNIPRYYEYLMPHEAINIKHTTFRRQFEKSPDSKRRTLLSTEVHKHVTNILGLQSSQHIEPDQNLFDLGIDSLSAIELRYQLQSSLEHSFDPNLLLKHSTIESLVDALLQEISPFQDSQRRLEGISMYAQEAATLIAMQPNGLSRPFFCVSGITGLAMNFSQLARHLGKKRPFYGLQSPGIDENSQPYMRVEEIAAHHIKTLQTVQLSGPYLLGGYSFGGLVAFEMARQLQDCGHNVGLLTIFDVQAMDEQTAAISDWDDTRYLSELMQTFIHSLGRQVHISSTELQAFNANEQLEYLIEQLTASGFRFTRNEIQRIQQVFKANILAHANYIPKPLSSVPITVFRPEKVQHQDNIAFEEKSGGHDQTLGWGRLTALPVNVQLVPGNHFTMMIDPYVQTLARQLKICLESVQGEEKLEQFQESS